ncbi:MAG: toll/interleukin-1 receptor domain-containing protein, partial [Candidatus Heimdallarchaeota archaeon]|nr:toll/interleukin-1 receptor domain-containing protein [Candidatus Heimdallarchaeota archaeon]
MSVKTMTKPILFISHSTSSLPETDRCVKVRKCLVSLLSKSGWEVFIDEQKINPGDTWRSKIIHNLAHAQAGIFLLNEKAISDSDWVSTEVSILCYRKLTNPNIQIIPVLFEDKKLDDICFKQYEPVQLKEIDAISDDLSLPKEFAAKIIAKLELDKAGAQKTQWVHKVIGLLKDVNLKALKCAAEALELEEYSCDLQDIHVIYVVERMDHNPPLRNIRAFSELLNQLDYGDAKRLITFLEAKWIENEAAQILINASRKPDKIGLLTINARAIEHTQYYLDRARFDIRGLVNTLSVSAAAGEGDDAKLYKIEEAIYNKLIPSGYYPDDDGTNLPWSQAILKHLASQKKVVICALPSEYAKERIL